MQIILKNRFQALLLVTAKVSFMDNFRLLRWLCAWPIRFFAVFFILFTCCAPFHAWATIAQAQSNEPSSKAQAICPELSKLAEVIALAHSIGQSREDTIRIIAQSMSANSDEMILLENLVNAIYDKPELTAYEHAQRTQYYCFEEFRRTETDNNDNTVQPAL